MPGTMNATTPRVLVLHTGGTIGMVEGPRGYEPDRGSLSALLERLPQLCDPSAPRFTTPAFRSGRRVGYDVVQYETLLDSANLDLRSWARIAGDIGQRMDAFDGFVILHGTDTMAYTASALSFMLEGLAKPVILTGSQIPLVQLRNDGLDNLLGAIGLAAHLSVPEVCVYFHHRLLRGNRASKHDAASLDAFASPNFPPLAEIGIDVTFREELVLAPESRPFVVHDALSPHVAALRVFPGITPAILENFLRPPLAGLVLETYGSGNFPDQRADLLAPLAAACARGLVVLNVTQCPRGVVKGQYAAGRALTDIGVLPGGDLTAEAALTKLAYVLGKALPPDETRALLVRPLRGEMSA
jgi:L-asparaginase type I